MIYKPSRFVIQELVSTGTYERFGDTKSWQFTDGNALFAIDMIAKRYSPKSPVIINNWMHYDKSEWDKPYVYKWCGNRTPDSPVHSKFSQHTFCRAYDLHFDKNIITAEEVRADLKVSWGKLRNQNFPITVENGVSWLHISSQPQEKLFNEFTA